jgi:hypothetical protein
MSLRICFDRHQQRNSINLPIAFQKALSAAGASGSTCNLSYSGGSDQEDCSSKPGK